MFVVVVPSVDNEYENYLESKFCEYYMVCKLDMIKNLSGRVRHVYVECIDIFL
eukprot:SAG11_NODE_1197_length_5544_cov_3.112397_2_plen_53_part_00